MPDLQRDLQADSTRLRVAIHFLERAGLLWRGYDLPRTARLRLSPSATQHDADFARFVEAAHLRPSQSISCRMEELCRVSKLDPRTIETQLLAWHSAGWLRYRGIGRDMLLALPVPPADSRQRVTAMLAEYHAGQSARLAEIMAYATTARCRHGHISAYFGGRRIERCQACDNCLTSEVTVPKTGRPTRQSRRKSQARPAKISTRTAQQSQGGTSDYDRALFERLRAWRLATAKERGWSPYIIFHNSVLEQIAAIHPTSLNELAAIKGIGPHKLEHYGEAVLAIVADRSTSPSNTDLG
jgi:hypothetical protein